MGNLIEKSDLTIDPYDLDNEWVKQPNLYGRYASMAADARRDFDEDKVQVDVVYAELDADIRRNPESYNLVKPTENSIKSAIPGQERYREAVQAMIDSRHHMDVVNAMVSALDHRKTALSKLVDLLLADYYSKPRASSGAKEETDEIEKRMARRKVRIRSGGGE